MSTEQITDLQALALTMPSHFQYAVRKLTGEELLDMGYEEWEGGIIHPDRTYSVPVAVQTNNVAILGRVLTTKGPEAMQDLVHRARGGVSLSSSKIRSIQVH